MKIRHNVPAAAYRPEAVTDEYQAEVDAATDKLDRAYAKASRRLAAAERRLAVAVADCNTANRRTALAAAVELRRSELESIAILMRASPQSAHHRGTKSYRPVPKPGGLL